MPELCRGQAHYAASVSSASFGRQLSHTGGKRREVVVVAVGGGVFFSAPSCPNHVTGTYCTFFFSPPSHPSSVHDLPRLATASLEPAAPTGVTDAADAKPGASFPLHSRFQAFKKKSIICGRKKTLRASFPKASESELKPSTPPQPTLTPAGMTRSRLTYHYNNWFINRTQVSFNMGEARALQPVVGSEEGQRSALNLGD